MDDVARRAGVGVGTVYRHFPTKEALIEALVAGRVRAASPARRARRSTSRTRGRRSDRCCGAAPRSWPPTAR